MTGNCHVRCGAGEKSEASPETYLSLLGEVPEFPSKLSTMRKYNISASIVLQDISQIEAMYDKDWKSLVGNCSTQVFLGTQQPDTLKYFSEELGKKTIRTRNLSTGKSSSRSFSMTGREVLTATELGMLPPDECIVFTQNKRPVRDKKYRYERHPYYPQTADADNSLGFQYNKMKVYNTEIATEMISIFQMGEQFKRAEEYRTAKNLAEKTMPDINVSPEDLYNSIKFDSEEEKQTAKKEIVKLAKELSKTKGSIFIGETDHMKKEQIMTADRFLAKKFGRKACMIFADLSDFYPGVVFGYGYVMDGSYRTAKEVFGSDFVEAAVYDKAKDDRNIRKTVFRGNECSVIIRKKNFDEYRDEIEKKTDAPDFWN